MYFGNKEADNTIDVKHIIKNRLLAETKAFDFENLDQLDDAAQRGDLNVELDVGKDEDLDDILSNDFWDLVDDGAYSKQK